MAVTVELSEEIKRRDEVALGESTKVLVRGAFCASPPGRPLAVCVQGKAHFEPGSDHPAPYANQDSLEDLAVLRVRSERSKQGGKLPLYMDVHSLEGGVSASDVADAHSKDLETQEKHGVNYKSYWVDANAGKIFCLVEAPNPEAANTVHREAHGLVAAQIYEVQEG